MEHVVELQPKITTDNNATSKLDNLNSTWLEIPRLNKDHLSYNDFFHSLMEKNIPCIINSISNKWDCRRQWITKDGERIDCDFMERKMKNIKVPVANCSKTYYNSHKKIEMELYDYLDYIRNRNIDDILYLKDWHLKALMPDYDFYKVPEYFASDWLNEYLLDNKKDDYRFVYIGPKGSWTPFHADVFNSYSWSTNIFGIKEWILLPPKEELKLKDQYGNDPFNISEELLKSEKVKYFKIIQNENESIFVPSGWYHQVWNVTDTISVNHNWFNGCNIHTIWKNLFDSMQKVYHEIDDCRMMENFHEHCQIMLKATFGMNLQDYFDILKHIAVKRLNFIENSKEFLVFDTYKFNTYHVMYDLKRIYKILTEIQNNFETNLKRDFIDQCTKLVKIIEEKAILIKI